MNLVWMVQSTMKYYNRKKKSKNIDFLNANPLILNAPIKELVSSDFKP